MATRKMSSILAQNGISGDKSVLAVQNMLAKLGADHSDDPRVQEYLAYLQDKGLAPDDLLPAFCGLRLRAVDGGAECSQCGRQCAYELVYDCGHYACPSCTDRRCAQCGREPRLRLVAIDREQALLQRPVAVEGGCGKTFTLGMVALHCEECPQCWLVSRYTPMQIRGMSVDELYKEGGRFTRQQLAQAKSAIVAALQQSSPTQSVFQIDVREDTDDMVRKEVYCSESEITQVVAGDSNQEADNCFYAYQLQDQCNELNRMLQAKENDIINVNNLLSQQRLQDYQLKEANQQLCAKVAELQGIVDTLTKQQEQSANSPEAERQAYQYYISALEQKIYYLQEYYSESDRQQAIEEAKVRYLVRVARNLQVTQGNINLNLSGNDVESEQSRMANILNESMNQESVSNYSLQVQKQIDEINRQLSDDTASLLLSQRYPPANVPRFRNMSQYENPTEQQGPRPAAQYEQELQRVSTAVDGIRGRQTSDIYGLWRDIMKNSVKRQQRQSANLASYGLDQKLAQIQRKKLMARAY